MLGKPCASYWKTARQVYWRPCKRWRWLPSSPALAEIFWLGHPQHCNIKQCRGHKSKIRMGRMQAGLCTQSCARKHQCEATACDPAVSQHRPENTGKRVFVYQSHFPFTASTACKNSCQWSMLNIKLFQGADTLSS